MPPLVVTLGFEILSDPAPGEWCDRCLLPSAVEVVGVLTLDAGAGESPLAMRRYLACQDCGQVVNG